MILVTLGTQDKSFHRLLEAIDNEIKKGNITDEVVVQAGTTKYESKNMKIFDFIEYEKFGEFIGTCDILITHGGVGSIITGLKNNKLVIAAPRLAKYNEHGNDHQLQIINSFEKKEFIKALYDFDKLGEVLKDIKKFKPKQYQSNTKNMIKLISDYIEKI